jgi:VWFA-related protein
MNLTAEHRMQELAKQTGGAVYAPLDEKELDVAFARISAELSQQYVLNYYPEDKMLSGDFHAITLKVKNRPGLSVRTRKGYYVPRKK